MRQFQVTLRRVLLVVVPIAAMAARAATSWGPANLVVLVAFVLIAAAGLACVPSIPHRPFWAGFAGFGLLYALIVAPVSAISGFDNYSLLPIDSLFRDLAQSRYGSTPDFHSSPLEELDTWPDRQRSKEAFVIACHAVASLGVGILGGCLLLFLAKRRESRRWDSEALPELPLEDFLLPPLKIDRPLNSK